MGKFFTVLLLIYAQNALALTRVGPMFNFEIYHRKSPEETDSLRLGAGLKFATDLLDNWCGAELAGLYSSGIDTFATSNSVDEKIYRLRAGVILRPLKIDVPLLGFRMGTQYSLVNGSYLNFASGQAQLERPRYWDPYFGVEVLVVPLAGFSVEEQFTVFYDDFMRGFVYQFSVGINLN